MGEWVYDSSALKLMDAKRREVVFKIKIWDLTTLIHNSLTKYMGIFIWYLVFQMCRVFITYLQSDEPVWRGYLYAFVLSLTSYLQSLSINIYALRMMQIGLQARTTLMSVVYRKVRAIFSSFFFSKSHFNESSFVMNDFRHYGYQTERRKCSPVVM